MSIVFAQRGGAADFKGWFCEGDWPEYGPPFSTPSVSGTPPYNSHAYGVYGQGYLNLHFPLVPDLCGTLAHQWMQNALKDIRLVDDVFITNFIPMRSYLTAIHYEVSATDPALDGVYITPIAVRAKYDFTTQDYTYTEIADFTNELAAYGVEKFPLGTPVGGDKRYGVALLSQTPNVTPCTFGHNLVTRDAGGMPTGGVDNFYGAVLLGYKFTEGDPAKIANVWRSKIAVYMSAKLASFEGSSQVG